MDNFVFYEPVKNDMRTYNIIRKITAVQGEDYIFGCLLYSSYFKHLMLIEKQNSKLMLLEI